MNDVDFKQALADAGIPTTEAGLRQNLSVGVAYLEAWLRGAGCVPLHHLMEDAATAEISRTQVWQWLRHRAEVTLDNGEKRALDADWMGMLLQVQIVRILDQLGPNAFHRGHYAAAARIFSEAVTAPQLPDFITVQAYPLLNALE